MASIGPSATKSARPTATPFCERSVFLQGGVVAFDGPTREAVARYRRTLADDVDPAERRGGLREWGSGEATVAAAAVRADAKAGE